MAFELSTQLPAVKAANDEPSSAQTGGEAFYLARALQAIEPEQMHTGPWGNGFSKKAENEERTAGIKQLTGAGADFSAESELPAITIQHGADSELLRKVQSFTRSRLDADLNTSQFEKRLVGDLQDSIIAGDTASFRKALKQLFDGLSIQGQSPEDRTARVRDDLHVVERILRQYCGTNINIDLSNDDRVIIRLNPDNLALEIGKNGDLVRKVIVDSVSVSLDNSKEVIRPTSAEFTRTISDRCLQSRQW